MIFSKFTKLYNHHLILKLEYFLPLKKIPIEILFLPIYVSGQKKKKSHFCLCRFAYSGYFMWK